MTEKRQSHLVEETGDKACVYSSHSNTVEVSCTKSALFLVTHRLKLLFSGLDNILERTPTDKDLFVQ